MAHLDPFEANKLLKQLREGKDVICLSCNVGYMRTKSDPKISYCFKCDKCGVRWDIDPVRNEK